SCFRSAPSLSVVAVTTLQFMPGILRWGEYREQFNEGLDAGNCAGYVLEDTIRTTHIEIICLPS
ncbi:MAG: hypothetical protein WB607_21970, partial [Candidatus Acidiferrum sp.]